MPTRRYDTPEGELTLWMSWWSGRETVRHRGTVVSEDRSFSLISRHRFQVPGRGPVTAIQYELWYGLFWGWNLKRNGVTIGEKRSGQLLSWLFSLGLLMITLQPVASVINRRERERLTTLPPPWPTEATSYVLPVAIVGAFFLAALIRKMSRDRLRK